MVARIRPNEDISDGIEAICRKHGFTAAIVRSGIGSVIDPLFADGRRVEADSQNAYRLCAGQVWIDERQHEEGPNGVIPLEGSTHSD